jgi:dihydropteroate synthase
MSSSIRIGAVEFPLGARAYVMGILNVTPDSFSDGGRYSGLEAALLHAEDMIEAGADILDVGGESTRPGATPVSEEEELRRVVPVVKALALRFPRIPLSVDTSKAEVARQALAHGAVLMNDVTAFRNPKMAQVVREAGAAACLMHMRGTPETMQLNPPVGDVMVEIVEALSKAIDAARAAGLEESRLLVDPGIGFGKTVEQNFVILDRLNELRTLGLPILVGTSRKSFLRAAASGRPADDRLIASVASVAAIAVRSGADFFRVHDVAATKEALRVADSIRGSAKDARHFSR